MAVHYLITMHAFDSFCDVPDKEGCLFLGHLGPICISHVFKQRCFAVLLHQINAVTIIEEVNKLTEPLTTFLQSLQCFKLRHQEGSERRIFFDALHYERCLCFLVLDHISIVYLIVWQVLLELILSCTGSETLGSKEIDYCLLHLTKFFEVEPAMAFQRCELQVIMVVHDLLVV